MQPALNIKEIVRSLREKFKEKLTYDQCFRTKQLISLKTMLNDNREKLVESLRKDFKKPIFEVNFEIDLSLSYIEYVLSNLKNWMAYENCSKNLLNTFNTLQLRCEPLGVVLIISPWNYPIFLPLAGLIGAIAAGNCVLIKPSEISPNISSELEELLPKYISSEHYKVITGGVDVATEILKEKFDHILYIGSTSVAKIVLQAAALHLTPTTLELGGKCPCYVDKCCDVNLAARKIAWAKMFNAGQICFTADYILCHKDIHDQFLDLVKASLIEFYGRDPINCSDFGRIVNQKHTKRLADLINRTKGTIVVGSDTDVEECYVSPTIITNIKRDDPLMNEEIFGPIIPIISVNDHYEAIDIMNSIPKPLTVYAFTKSNNVVDSIRCNTSSGSLVINDIIMQLLIKELPFGGVDESGMGRFLGKSTFDIFSNKKGFYHKRFYLNYLENYALPPIDQHKYNLAKWII